MVIMPACAAFGCSNSSSKNIPGISFHQFPKNPHLRKAWIIACRRKNWSPSRASILCSEHFSEDQIHCSSFLNRVRLRENAIPNIFKSVPSYLQKEKKLRKSCTNNIIPISSKCIASNGEKSENEALEEFPENAIPERKSLKKKAIKQPPDCAIHSSSKCTVSAGASLDINEPSAGIVVDPFQPEGLEAPVSGSKSEPLDPEVVENRELPTDGFTASSFTCTEPTVVPIDNIRPMVNMVVDPLQSKRSDSAVSASTSGTCLKVLCPEVKAPSLWVLVPAGDESENVGLEESSEKGMLQRKLIVKKDKSPENFAIPTSYNCMLPTREKSENEPLDPETVALKKKLLESKTRSKEYVKQIKALYQKIRRRNKKIEKLTRLAEEFKCQELINQEILDIPGKVAGVIYVLK